MMVVSSRWRRWAPAAVAVAAAAHMPHADKARAWGARCIQHGADGLRAAGARQPPRPRARDGERAAARPALRHPGVPEVPTGS